MNVNKEQYNCDKTRIIKATQKLKLQMVLESADVNLLCGNANAYITSCRNNGGEVRAEGMVRGNVTLENEEFDLLSTQQEFAFSVPCDDQAVVNAVAQVSSCATYREGNSAVLDVEIAVSFICVEPANVQSVSQADNLQLLTKEVSLTQLVGMYNQSGSVHENIELNVRMPQVKQCLQATPNAVVDKILVQSDAVMISGDIVLSVLYCCGDEYEPIAQVADRLPFSIVIDAPGAKPEDKAIVLVNVSDGTVIPKDNEQGEKRILGCVLGINALVCLTRENTVSVVTDAYSTECMLECTNQHISLDSVDFCQKQQSVRVMLEKPENMPPIARVCSVNGFIRVDKITPYNGGATLSCTACYHTVYIVSGSGELAGFNASQGFELNIDCDCDPNSILDGFISTEMLQAALLSGSKCEIRMVLNVSLIINNRDGIKIITDIQQGRERERYSGICIYIAQPGDTLFTVGQQLGVTVEDLLVLNGELKEKELIPGTRITVFK